MPDGPEVDDLVRRLRTAGCVFAEDEAALLIDAATVRAATDGGAADGGAMNGVAADGVAVDGRCVDGGVLDGAVLADMVERRCAGLPLEHVVGWAQFCGLRVVVGPGVFVPRRRTEFLAERAILLARSRAQGRPRAPGRPPAPAGRVVVLDLCCGSGAVAAAVAAAPMGAAAVDGIELHAAELDPVAVRYAVVNVGTAGHVYAGDLYDPLPDSLRGRVDVLVANAPYVPTGAIATMPPEARLHEPHLALDGGGDGLDVLRRVIAGAPGWLAPGGYLLVESSGAQAAEVVAAFARHGLDARIETCEEDDAAIVVGTLASG